MDGKTREESDTTEAMIAFSVALSHSFFSRDGLCNTPIPYWEDEKKPTQNGQFMKIVMSTKSHIAQLLGETGLYNESKGSFKLTSHFGVITQMWLALFPGSLQELISAWAQFLLEIDEIIFNKECYYRK